MSSNAGFRSGSPITASVPAAGTARNEEGEQLNARIDNVLTGALGQSVRGHESRISTTEAHVRDFEVRLAAVVTKVS